MAVFCFDEAMIGDGCGISFSIASYRFHRWPEKAQPATCFSSCPPPSPISRQSAVVNRHIGLTELILG